MDEKQLLPHPPYDPDNLPAVPGHEALKDVTDAILRAYPRLSVAKLKRQLDAL